DKIYIIDLHGNTIKKEKAPDGSIDKNVFDITQGVCINIFVKTGKKKNNELGKIFHFDLFGKREDKYQFLFDKSLKTINYNEVAVVAPNYFFVNKNFEEQKKYEAGFSVNDLFTLNNVGIVTASDPVLINDFKNELLKNVERKFVITTDKNIIQKISYRPFDNKFVYYDTKLLERAREKVMQHFIKGENIGLVIGRQGQVVGNMQWNLSFITNSITDFNLYYRGGGVLFPLYLYPENTTQQSIHQSTERTVNFNMQIIDKIAADLNLCFVEDDNLVVDLAAGLSGTLYPTQVLDYIYTVLHSPTYREKYKEFLKIDFPRIPYPKTYKVFKDLIGLGSQLRQIHLLESPIVEQYITQYPLDGNNVVTKIKISENYTRTENGITELIDPAYRFGRVYINDTQYFEGVPLEAWEFYIGGYQPAQKWLKDRKGRALDFDDILHYQKIIVALTETSRLIQQIDKIEIE
nr:hypothetical protein [Ferruginibacter sp.]